MLIILFSLIGWTDSQNISDKWSSVKFHLNSCRIVLLTCNSCELEYLVPNL